jgi:hypothetical protein
VKRIIFGRELPLGATGGFVNFSSVRTVSRYIGEYGEGEILLRQTRVFE